MPTVLLLYPGPPAVRHGQVARHAALIEALGLRLVLADDVLVARDRELFAGVIELPEASRVTEGWEVLRRAAAGLGVEAVLAQRERALPLGALLAQERGLPGLSVHAAFLCASKLACRRALEEARIGQPRHALVADAAGVRAFARENGWPVVLKAVASTLSKLVTLARDEGEVDAAVARVRAGLTSSADVRRIREFAALAGEDPGCEPEHEFLVEEFLTGEAVEADGVVCKGEPRPFGVVAQRITPPPLFYIDGYLYPAPRPRHELDEVEATAAAALRALDVRDTGYSIEMRVREGRARIIEVNGRLGWDDGFGELFETRLGVSPVLLALQIALGMAPRFETREGVHAALAYRNRFEGGVVERVPPPEELARAARGLRALEVVVERGARFEAQGHPDFAPHLAWALAEDDTSSAAAYERAAASLQRLSF